VSGTGHGSRVHVRVFTGTGLHGRVGRLRGRVWEVGDARTSLFAPTPAAGIGIGRID
jgi:hypothetical protein